MAAEGGDGSEAKLPARFPLLLFPLPFPPALPLPLLRLPSDVAPRSLASTTLSSSAEASAINRSTRPSSAILSARPTTGIPWVGRERDPVRLIPADGPPGEAAPDLTPPEPKNEPVSAEGPPPVSSVAGWGASCSKGRGRVGLYGGREGSHGSHGKMGGKSILGCKPSLGRMRTTGQLYILQIHANILIVEDYDDRGHIGNNAVDPTAQHNPLTCSASTTASSAAASRNPAMAPRAAMDLQRERLS